MSNERIDLKHYENKYTFQTPIDPNWKGAPWTKADLKVILDELKRCYKQIDLLTKAFMMAGNHGYYMTICEECYDVHTLDDECPFVCELCGEKNCECPASD